GRGVGAVLDNQFHFARRVHASPADGCRLQRPLAHVAWSKKTMKTILASVLGLAVLVAITCVSSLVYADALEAASSAMQTLAPDATANGAESVDKLPCESSCVGAEHCTGDAQAAEVDQPSSAVSEASPAPAVQSADAIIVEVTQTVTIVVPGDEAADSEEPT